MPFRPIPRRKFEKYLKSKGCYLDRIEGDHRIFERKDLLRPLTVTVDKDVPPTHIKTNLNTLGITSEVFYKEIESF